MTIEEIQKELEKYECSGCKHQFDDANSYYCSTCIRFSRTDNYENVQH